MYKVVNIGNEVCIITKEDEAVKRCSCCGMVKPVSKFYRRTKSKDGYQSQCIRCGKVKSYFRYLSLRREV